MRGLAEVGRDDVMQRPPQPLETFRLDPRGNRRQLSGAVTQDLQMGPENILK